MGLGRCEYKEIPQVKSFVVMEWFCILTVVAFT